MMKKILFSLLVLVLLPLGGIGGGYYYLETPGGKRWLADVINAHANDPAHGALVAIDGIDGTIPGDIHIHSLTVSDQGGVYLRIDNLHLAWNPFALLHHDIEIHTLTASGVTLVRLPVITAAPSTPHKPFSFPDIPAFRMDHLDLARLTVGAALAGQEQTLHLSGGGTREHYRLNLTTLSGPKTELSLQTRLKSGAVNGTVALNEPEGGILAGLLKLPPSSPVSLNLAFRTDDSGVIHIAPSSLTAASATLNLHGDYDLGNKRLDGDGTVAIRRLSDFSALASTPLSGAAQASFTLKGQPDALNLKIAGQSGAMQAAGHAIKTLDLKSDILANLAHASADIHATIGLSLDATPITAELSAKADASRAEIASLHLTYGTYGTQASGTVELNQRRLHLRLQADPMRLRALWPSAPLDGPVETSAAIDGGFDRMDTDVKTTIHLQGGDSSLRYSGNVDTATRQANGTLAGDLNHDKQHFDLKAKLAANPATLRADALQFRGNGFSLTGDVAWDMATSLAQASLALDAEDLRPLAALLGEKAEGSAHASVKLVPDGARQKLDTLASLHGVRWNEVSLEDANLTAHATDAKHPDQMSATATLSGLFFGSARLRTATINVAGSLGGLLTVAANAEGNAAGNPFSLTMLASDTHEKHDAFRHEIAVARLNGAYAGKPFGLKSPARLRLTRETAELSPAAFALAHGVVTLNGAVSPAKLDATLAAHDVRLDELPLSTAPESTLGATLTLTGTPARPRVNLTSQLSVREADYPLTLALHGIWVQNHLSLRGTGSGDKTRASFSASLDAPLSFSPFLIGLNGGTALGGSLTASGTLDLFNPYLRAGDERMSGTVTASSTFAGTLAAPSLTGKVSLTRAQIDLHDSSLCMRSMDARISANGKVFSLDSLNATSETGTLDAHASVGMSADHTLDARADFKHFHLFCGGMATGQLDGFIAAEGRAPSLKITGKLTTPALNVQLPDATDTQTAIPQVTIVRARKAAPDVPAPPATLDISLSVPNRMFVRGRGLDAEFGGAITIRGTATRPEIEGQFTTQRGKFTLLDHDLTLTSGTIQFEGPIPPSPFLNIQAQSGKVQDATVSVGLTGPATNPVLTFTSDPPKPQDEVLALLLFGRDLSSLSPFQVVQLAQSAAELSGHGGGPGALSKVRSFLGVDTLDVGTDSNNDVTVGTGKYITDKIYVGVTQGAKPESRAVNTEVEILPKVSANTAIGTGGDQSVGLQWKYDY